MKIERIRYVVMKNNRTEIWCVKNQGNYVFKPVNNIGNIPIKTYNSVTNAERGTGINWNKGTDVEIVEVKETIEWKGEFNV